MWKEREKNWNAGSLFHFKSKSYSKIKVSDCFNASDRSQMQSKFILLQVEEI